VDLALLALIEADEIDRLTELFLRRILAVETFFPSLSNGPKTSHLSTTPAP
jgi:hypothetical protein